MCSACCSEYCDCNTTCCFGFVVPLKMGTVFAGLWILFGGLTFPIMSLLFWPQTHIMISSCLTFAFVAALVGLLFLNMKLKVFVVFRIVVYGVFAAYLMGCLSVAIGLNVDTEGSVDIFVSCLRKHFGMKTSKSSGFQMLQSIQIVYYTYLFFSYVYCGAVFQWFEMRNCEKKSRKKSGVVVCGAEVEDGGCGSKKASVMRKTGVGGDHESKEKKTVRIVLPDRENDRVGAVAFHDRRSVDRDKGEPSEES